jgi:hypothetical protein
LWQHGPAEEKKAKKGGIMFDHLCTGQLDRWPRSSYTAKRWNRRFPVYGHRFALAGLTILVVVGLFAISHV